MSAIPDWLRDRYLRLITPVVDWLIAKQISPNAITVIGTLFWIGGGGLYAAGRIRSAGLLLGVTALFDVLDGQVARKSGRSSTFGAFLDSTLDRVADAAVLGGLAYFYATHPSYGSTAMLAVCLAGLTGTLLISYTRARAESLGLFAKVGMMQRPERVVLLTAPQAFFGLALNGMILGLIIIFLTVTAWITVLQRVLAVHRATESRTPERGHRSVEPPAVRQATMEARGTGQNRD